MMRGCSGDVDGSGSERKRDRQDAVKSKSNTAEKITFADQLPAFSRVPN